MFKRLNLEEWERALSLLAWAMFVLVFIATTIRAFRMSRESVQKLENLPLENDHHE